MPSLTTLKYATIYGKSSAQVVQVQSTGTNDAYVVKYDANGSSKWAARVATSGTDTTYAITTDSSGNVYATGVYSSGSVTIGAACLIYNADGTAFGTLPNSGGSGGSGFIIKYTPVGNVLWAARLVGVNGTIIRSITVDSSGNSYLTGNYSQTATIYNADGTVFGTLSNAGSDDIFVVKYNTNGIVQWSTRIASAGADAGFSVATDSGGNVYVAGTYAPTTGTNVTIFNADTTTFTTLTNSGVRSIFVVKYNTSGVGQWAARIGSASGTHIGYGIAVDSSGNVYLTGTVSNTATVFNANGTTFGTITGAAGFIVEYNTDGAVQWTTRMTATAVTPFGIATDASANVYITGSYNGNLTILNSSGTTFGTLTNSGNTGVFLIKYNGSGTAQWSTRIVSVASIGYAVAVDSSANVYITGQGGSGASIVVYNAGDTIFSTLANTGSNDAFLVKYNTNGAVQLARKIASSGVDIGDAINVDSNGNIYTGGQFNGSSFAIYGQSISLFTTLANAGNTDAFVVKYNRYGAPQWASRIASSGADIGFECDTDSSGNVYVSGSYGAALTIYNIDGTTNRTFAFVGAVDAFLIKYDPNGTILWATRIAGGDNDWPNGIAVDSAGSVYVGGEFRTSLTIYNSDTTTFGTLSSSASGNSDIFIVKFDTNGFAQWRARCTSTSAFEVGYSVATDSSNNVYLAGTTGGQLMTILNADDTTFGTLGVSGSTDACLLKYSSSGTVQWATRVAATGLDNGFVVKVDTNDNVFFGGSYTGTATVFNSDTTTFRTLTGVSLADGFLVKYNTNGIAQWAIRLTASNLTNDTVFACNIDLDGNVYVGGTMTPIIYNSDDTAFTSSNAGGPGLLIKYNPNGFAQWVVSFSTSAAGVYSIDTDSFGNVYVGTGSGLIDGNISAVNADGSVFATVAGFCALFKYDRNGVGQWVQYIRGINIIARTVSIATNSIGDCYLTGHSISGVAVSIYNIDRTPYKFLNTPSGTSVFVTKYSSTMKPLWATLIASQAYVDAGWGIRTDSAGNVYVNGNSGNGTAVDIYNADGRIYKTISNSGLRDVYLVKYNSNGFGQWTTRIASNREETSYNITIDPSDNIILGASVSGGSTTVFNSDDTTFGTVSNSGGTDVFLVKYDPSGFAQWTARIASTVEEYTYGVSSDSSGSIILTGHFAGTITIFSSNGASFGTLTQTGGDAFIVKYNSSGIAQWATRVSGSAADYGIQSATDTSGNVYVTGFYAGTATIFNAGGTTFGTLTNAGNDDAFLVKYNTSGAVQWATRISGTGFDSGRSVTTDSAGNVYLCGISGTATVTIFNANGTTFGTIAPISSSADVILVKYNTSGVVQWAAKMATSATNVVDLGFSVATDAAGAVYVSGSSGGTGAFAAYNAGTTTQFGSAASSVNGFGTESFIVKYSSSGIVEWISNMGGLGGDTARAVFVDSQGSIYSTGVFTASALVPSSTA